MPAEAVINKRYAQRKRNASHLSVSRNRSAGVWVGAGIGRNRQENGGGEWGDGERWWADGGQVVGRWWECG